jgi:hypothetical protein
MTPEALAVLHPRLYHVTTPGAWDAISKRGLIPASALLALFDVDVVRQAALTTARRPREVRIEHPVYGTAILNDNLPLSERALASCLDDGLRPQDWFGLLNARVFFWAGANGLDRLLGARMNRNRPREVLIFDTLSLARAHAERIEISPINSGSTIRKAARRGRTTFTPLLAKSYPEWQRQRGKRDRILEVVVNGSVPDIADHFVGIRTTEATEDYRKSAFRLSGTFKACESCDQTIR